MLGFWCLAPSTEVLEISIQAVNLRVEQKNHTLQNPEFGGYFFWRAAVVNTKALSPESLLPIQNKRYIISSGESKMASALKDWKGSKLQNDQRCPCRDWSLFLSNPFVFLLYAFVLFTVHKRRYA